jgi:hypothetical protein
MHAARALRLGAARSVRFVAAARRGATQRSLPLPPRANASSPKAIASMASPPPAAPLGGAAPASGSPRGVAAAAAATADAPTRSNPLLSEDLFPRFDEARACVALCRFAAAHAARSCARPQRPPPQFLRP